MKENKLSFDKMRSAFFFGLIIVLGIAILYLIGPFVYPVFWAAVIAVLFYPLYRWLLKFLKVPGITSFITLILIIIILFLPLIGLSTILINESKDLYQASSEWDVGSQVSHVSGWFTGTWLEPTVETVKIETISYINEAKQNFALLLVENLKTINDVYQNIKSATIISLRFVFMLFIMFYTLYYFLKDGPKMLKRLMHLSPLGDEAEQMLYDKFTSTSRATLKGTLLVGAIQGTLGGVVLALTGVEGAFIWGVVMVFLSIIPALGPFIVLLPAGIIMLIIGDVWQGTVILTIGLGVTSVIDNLLRPPLVGKDIQMHPLLVLFSTLGGLIMFGISGFVIGPIIAALFVAIMSIYDHHYRNELSNN
jgi:predicted PurR-regulated permease PerM